MHLLLSQSLSRTLTLHTKAAKSNTATSVIISHARRSWSNYTRRSLSQDSSDWETITPNTHYDWIEQRSEVFTDFYLIGSEETKAGRTDNTIFKLFSSGYLTGRDAYIYNFSIDTCAENVKIMTQDYLAAIAEFENNPELTVDNIVHRYSTNIKWDGDLKKKLRQRKKTNFMDNYIRKVSYRPFVATNCYADYTFAQRKYQMDQQYFSRQFK